MILPTERLSEKFSAGPDKSGWPTKAVQPQARVPVAAARNRRWKRVLVIVVAACVVAGCVDSQPSPREPERREPTDGGVERILENTVAILQQGQDGTMFEAVQGQLNHFVRRRADAIASLDAGVAAELERLLGPGAVATASRKEFDALDTAIHLRNSLFLHAAARRLRAAHEDDLACARHAFEWVNRFVEIVPAELQPEGPPYDVCLRGSGSGRDRAWVFLEILRQAGLLGTMVGIPDPADPQRVRPWVCGVLIGPEVYLFDPELGVPLHSGSGRIATLRELSQDPSIVERCLVDSPTPVRPEQIHGLSLILLLTPQLVAPRMQFLQRRLIGAGRANLYLDLVDTLDRARRALDSVPGNRGLGVWDHPGAVLARLASDPAHEMSLLASSNLCWRSIPDSPRLLQLRGEHEEAIKKFVQYDLGQLTTERLNDMLMSLPPDRQPPPALRRRLVAQTRQDILYFNGLSNLEKVPSEPRVARQWFEQYLAQYGSHHLRVDEVLDWGAFLISGIGCQIVDKLTVDAALDEDERQILRATLGVEVGKEGRLDPKTRQGVLTFFERWTNAPRRRFWALLPGEAHQVVRAAAQDWLANRQLEHEMAGIREFYAARQKEQGTQGDLAEQSQLQDLQQELDQARTELQARSRRAAQTLIVRIEARQRIVAAFNQVLERPDLYQEAAFRPVRPVLSGGFDEALAGLLSEKDATKLGPAAVLQRNRRLLDAAYPFEIAESRCYWRAGAIRQLAVALREEGQTTQALDRLGTAEPELLPIQQAALRALSRWWQSE